MQLATNQAIQKLILTYLDEQPDFLEVIRQKFFSAFTPDPLWVDDETEQRIGQALEDVRRGDYITVAPDETILDALNNFEHRLTEEKIERDAIDVHP